MKLLMVLMLAVLPLFCDAGAGCNLVKDVIEWTIDGNMTTAEYVQNVKPYITFDAATQPIITMKECFNNQTSGTLDNIAVLVETIYDSSQCKLFKS